MKVHFLPFLFLAGTAWIPIAQAGCLESAPKPSAALLEKCKTLGTFGMNRGATTYIPYEKADDGGEKEHSPPKGPRTFLLDFTKSNTGRLLELMEGELLQVCAYYYEGTKYNLKDSKENMAFLIHKNNAPAFEKKFLHQVFKEKNELSVADLARLSKEFSSKATSLGDAIFKDQLIPHAGSLEPSYQKEYLGKMKATLASLKGDTKDYVPSDCDYLNAPINHLYGLIQLSRLTAAMAKDSCPEEVKALDLDSKLTTVRTKIERDWSMAVHKAVLGSHSREGTLEQEDAGSSSQGQSGSETAR